MVALDATLGAMEIGMAISYYLFGICTLQTFIYFKSNSKDSFALKALVTTVYCLELAKTIGYSYGFYVLSIKFYGHSEIVMTKNNSISLHVAGLLGGAVDFLVQAFLANRVRRCFKTPYIASVCWMLAFLRFACSIATTIVVITLGPSLPPKWDWLFDATCMISVLVDIIIAASLCYHLAQGRKNSRSRRTIRLIDRIIAMTIPTGLVTSVVDIAMFVCFLTLPNTSIYLSMCFFEPSLFSNCFLALLNSRETLLNMVTGVQTSFLGLEKPHSLSGAPAIEIEMPFQGLSPQKKLHLEAQAHEHTLKSDDTTYAEV